MTAKLLSRDAILGASDIKTEEVPSRMGRHCSGAGADREAARQGRGGHAPVAGISWQNRPDMRNLAWLACGRSWRRWRLLTSMAIACSPTQMPELLGEKSGAALDRVFAVVTRLSEFSDGDIEELVGNSDADPSGDSSSD
jgi:hypothetical protein